MLQPPVGSKIQITSENGNSKILIPSHFSVIHKLLNGIIIILVIFAGIFFWKVSENAFLQNTKDFHRLINLIIITIGILFFIFVLFRNFKPTLSETITLSQFNLKYDSGIAPLPIFSRLIKRTPLLPYVRILFQRRVKTEISCAQLKTLALRNIRAFIPYKVLIVRDQNKSYYLGLSSNNADREWLFKVIQDYYKLKP
jgi:hypothetical protein